VFKNSRRLSQIDSMITSYYQNIWDCCCDHGSLGFALLQRKAAKTIHFTDIVESLIDKINQQLIQHFGRTEHHSRWKTHCIDAAKIPFSQYCSIDKANENNKQLIIIAGVGGELLIELLTSIINNNKDSFTDQPIEFILCPVHYNYQVRAALIKLNASLINEVLIEENNRFYEILHVVIGNKNGVIPVSNVGSTMWDFEKKAHQEYLDKTIKHYQRMQLNSALNVKAIISAYQALD